MKDHEDHWHIPTHNTSGLPVPIDVAITLWLEWFDNSDGYWDADAKEYRQCEK